MALAAVSQAAPSRVDLYRVLADEDRLRILALAAEAELSVGELAELLGESQPQLTKKSQPLRDATLLSARREGTRTLLATQLVDDPLLTDALEEGRRLCRKDGSLARVPAIIQGREESSRRFFAEARADSGGIAPDTSLGWLEAFGSLLPSRALAIDAGTGEGTLLPVLSPLYQRVIAVDRSAARLARCAARISSANLGNVRLREGDAEDPALYEEVTRAGGADLVACARVLHHAARPADSVLALARLLKPGGALLIIDYEPHHEESLRETQGDVWLGFSRAQLEEWLRRAQLSNIRVFPLTVRAPAGEPDHPLPLHAAFGVKP
ncbi:MAG: methyltransferase domain-containing protein [Deltaproteobacteria bacterium]|nr:methyltransferase domain-containing protein [Deltaproteobacteria bacterium]